MKPIIFLIMILLALPMQAQADWSGAGMHPVPGPNLAPIQGHIESQHRAQAPQPIEHHVAPVEKRPPMVLAHHEPVKHDPFYRNAGFYNQDDDNIPFVTVSPTIDLPDGLETIVVDGQTFFYSDGIFYQEVADQLTVISPVLGAVVDSIPQDYQVVMVDGVNYLVAEGVYYQRVEQGFEVVQPPTSDQE